MSILTRNGLPKAGRFRSAFTFQPGPDAPEFELTGHVEWSSSTKALVDYFGSIGIPDPGRMARSTIEEFGTLADFLSAPSWRLKRALGSRLARTIRSSHRLMKATLEEQIIDGPVVPRSKALVDLLQTEIGFLNHERLLALYVDAECRLMRIERIADGDFNQAVADNRTIIGCALAIGAAAFILVHNHPSGIPKPSRADLEMTDRLKRLAADFDLVLLDHFIVARGRFATVQDYWREWRWSQPQDS